MKNRILLEKKIKEFLSEDLGFGDITTDALIEDSWRANAEIVFKEEGILAGTEEAAAIFEMVGCQTQILIKDGEMVKPHTIILKIDGPAKAILEGERVSLNILMRMSGIATATKHVLSIARKVNSKIRVTATRKTTPGFRYFEKKAVKIGGGDTHRLCLDDCVLIKNNHLKFVPSINQAVNKVLDSISFTKKVEIEVESTMHAIEAVKAGADIVMLDNMTPMEIQSTLRDIKSSGIQRQILFEASGGITINNITDYAKTGVDILSLGSLTHSAHAIDISLRIKSIHR
jgi:nicotinate-nucleotide pyrophosphorylase (carboxylating)